jgi:formylglycine-generating enzyme required for sulfatase activity
MRCGPAREDQTVTNCVVPGNDGHSGAEPVDRDAGSDPRRTRRRSACALLAVLIAATAAACSSSTSSGSGPADVGGPRGTVTITMATVGDPGNPSVGVVQTFGGPKGQFVEPPANAGSTGIYKSCSDAPSTAPSCLTVGGVDYTYGIGEFDVTVSQYVTFLNTVDPNGNNPHELYFEHMSPTAWPKYGSIRFSSSAGAGQHYSVAYPEWAEKPFGFTNFRRAARFVNSMTNGTILSHTQSSSGSFKYVTYTVRLSPNTETGMYDIADRETTRTKSKGFVLPSNDEWVKAAYYDPNHGGTDSYWRYPTGPFNPPNPSKLNANTGEVVNASTQPLSSYNPNDPASKLDTPGSPLGPPPTWCPPQAGTEACETVNPLHLPQKKYHSIYQSSSSTVGQTKTPSPWGTFDQGGNGVEWTETIAPQPSGHHFLRVWRFLHGGVPNAPAWQLGISAFGYIDQDNKAVDNRYPWQSFRVGIVGNLE